MSRANEMRALRASVDAGHSQRADLRRTRSNDLANKRQVARAESVERVAQIAERAAYLRLMLESSMDQLKVSAKQRRKQTNQEHSARVRSIADIKRSVVGMAKAVAGLRKTNQSVDAAAHAAWNSISK